MVFVQVFHSHDFCAGRDLLCGEPLRVSVFVRGRRAPLPLQRFIRPKMAGGGFCQRWIGRRWLQESGVGRLPGDPGPIWTVCSAISRFRQIRRVQRDGWCCGKVEREDAVVSVTRAPHSGIWKIGLTRSIHEAYVFFVDQGEATVCLSDFAGRGRLFAGEAASGLRAVATMRRRQDSTKSSRRRTKMGAFFKLDRWKRSVPKSAAAANK